jgi:hypothetical protein
MAGVPDPSLEGLAVSVHMFNELFWGLAFATTDAERLELLRQMSNLGSQMLFEMVPITSRVQTRFRAAGARARAARSAARPSQHPDRGPGGAS